MGQYEYYATANSARSSGYSTSNIAGSEYGINTNIGTARVPYRIRHRKAFIWIVSVTLLLCLAHLGIAIFIAAVVSPNSTYYDSVMNETYSPGSLVSRVRMVFLWCTIPFVMSIVATFDLVQITRNRLPSKWMVTSASICGAIWGVQLCLTGICNWGVPSWNALSNGGLCPWYYYADDGYQNWPGLTTTATIEPFLIIPVLCMYVVYFSVAMRAVVIDKRDAKAMVVPAMVAKEDSLSLHTLSTSPVAETLVTDTLRASTRASTHGFTRPPSYFSDAGVSSDSYDVKKD